jgi:hypothetical protein
VPAGDRVVLGQGCRRVYDGLRRRWTGSRRCDGLHGPATARLCTMGPTAYPSMHRGRCP